jgi:hypothetical protein
MDYATGVSSQLENVGCPTLNVAHFATLEPALSGAEGVGILTSAAISPATYPANTKVV